MDGGGGGSGGGEWVAVGGLVGVGLVGAGGVWWFASSLPGGRDCGTIISRSTVGVCRAIGAGEGMWCRGGGVWRSIATTWVSTGVVCGGLWGGGSVDHGLWGLGPPGTGSIGDIWECMGED